MYTDRDNHISTWESLHHDHYSVQELARLLGMGESIIEHAVFSGDLKAQMADHHIVSILRSDALAWLRVRNATGTSSR